MRMTYGSPKVICAIIKVVNPNSSFRKTNRSIMDTPVTISGLIMGRYVKFIIADFIHLFMELIPTAAAVPMIVAIREDTTAMIRVLIRD